MDSGTNIGALRKGNRPCTILPTRHIAAHGNHNTPQVKPSQALLAATAKLRPLPYATAHWSVPLLLAAALIWFELTAQPCQPASNPGLGVALITAIILVALWSNHLANAPVRGFKGATKIILDSFYDVIGLVLLVSLPMLIFTPAYQCYTDHARVPAILDSVGPLREAIGARAAASGSLAHAGAGLKVGRTTIRSIALISGGVVTEDGVIAVIAEKPMAALILTPTLTAGRVEWTCRGFPQQAMPEACR